MDSGISTSAARANPLFGEVVIGSLKRLGVRHFVVSPGSRSTPLVLAAAGDRDQYTVILDERSAAFHALGIVKATGEPAALLCTSGTAGAHYFPALIEARESALPLVVLTADRPPELRHCHAGQTIDQAKLYGTYPVFHAELPLPETDPLLLRQVREICRQAVTAAMGVPGGPVHLNCPFREPFYDADAVPAAPPPGFWEGLSPVRPRITVRKEPVILPERTLILAGPRSGTDSTSELEALKQISARNGFPVLTDGSNPLRYGKADSWVRVIHHDRIARHDALWNKLAPEAVLLWGEPPTSKVLRQRLTGMDIPGYAFGTGKQAINPFNGRIQWIGSCADQLDFRREGPGDSGFAGEWESADASVEASLKSALSADHPFFEGDVHRVLGECLPEGAPLVFASSMAIRDAEWFIPLRETTLRPFSQRGANGIDGTVSLTRGIAAGAGRPAYLVSGDLAFLHDSNGLLGSADAAHGLCIVVLNNAGGGIFEFLPVAGKPEAFEPLFAAPQPVNLQKLVEAHGGSHFLADSEDALCEAVVFWDGRGLRVVEVPVDRKVSRDLHRHFLKELEWE